ncbi:HNH endonuclease, partial [Mycolicibacterium sp. P1-5]
MLSIEVGEALDAIDAALTTLAKVDVAGLAVMDVLELAARCEKATRHHDVVRYDLSLELHRRDINEIGGKAGKVLADWLRITPAEARRRA